MRTLITVPLSKKSQYITITEAADSFGFTVRALRWYIDDFHVELFKFPYDRKAYMKRSDYRRIKASRALAEA